MNVLSFPFKYILWHYKDALYDIFGIFKNYFWAISHFFSARLILNSFISPIHQIGESETYKNGKITSIIFHSLSFWFLVIFGIAMRLIALITLATCLFLLIIFALLAYMFWLSLPVIMFFVFLSAITMLIV